MKLTYKEFNYELALATYHCFVVYYKEFNFPFFEEKEEKKKKKRLKQFRQKEEDNKKEMPTML